MFADYGIFAPTKVVHLELVRPLYKTPLGEESIPAFAGERSSGLLSPAKDPKKVERPSEAG